MNEFCITGLGIITAIGKNLQENLDSLLAEKTGIQKVNYLQTIHRETLLAEVKATNDELKSLAGISHSKHYDRTSLLGMIAAKEALEHAKIKDPSGVGLVSSTSVGGMCYSELEFPKFRKDQEYSNFIDTHECAASTFEIAEHLGMKSYTDTISTACSSSANAIMQACNLIKNGICDVVMAGGTDALSLFTLNGFNTLMILDKEWCRPFDNTRAGLNLGEGAAFLMIESKASAQKRGAEILAYVSGYANANDAYHQTASSPEGRGATSAIKNAIQMAGLEPKNIDYINAHGTATPNNDLSESKAIQAVFGEDWPKFSSTKSYTGHTLAACGSIEAIYSILSFQNSKLFPCINFKDPMQEFHKIPLTEVQNVNVLNHVLSNSFGFGGNCSSLILSKA